MIMIMYVFPIIEYIQNHSLRLEINETEGN